MGVPLNFLRKRVERLAPGAGRAKSTRRSTPIGLGVLVAVLALIAPVALADSWGRDGGATFYAHVFPVDGPHGTRGAIGEFGAPRDGGRTHEGFDIVAACGTPLVSVVTGRVLRTGYDPVLYGNYLLIHGEGEDRSYFYAHMPRPARVHRGERVWAGERVGAVGETGNARTVGCHLHFEIHVHGHPIDPEPELRSLGPLQLEPQLVLDPLAALGAGGVVEALGGTLSGAVCPLEVVGAALAGDGGAGLDQGSADALAAGRLGRRRGRSSAPSRRDQRGEVPVEAGVADAAPRRARRRAACPSSLGARKREKKARLRSSSTVRDRVEALVGGDQRQQRVQLRRGDRLDSDLGRHRRHRSGRRASARPQAGTAAVSP